MRHKVLYRQNEHSHINSHSTCACGRFALRERELRKREEALAAKEQDYKRRVSALKRLEKKQMHHNKEHRHKINRRRSADDVGLRQNLG